MYDTFNLYIYTTICRIIFYVCQKLSYNDQKAYEEFSKFMILEGTKLEDGSFAVKVTLKGDKKLIEKINDRFNPYEWSDWEETLHKSLEWGI